MNNENPEPGVALLLTAQAKQRKKRAGKEPADLLAIARYVDGDLPPDERARVASLIEGDPDLSAMVAALRQHDVRGSEAGTRMAPVLPLPSNVISLSERARRLPEKRPNTTRRLIVGVGSVLAIAAMVFLVTRPSTEPTSTTHGASMVGSSAVSVTASFSDFAGCELTGVLNASSPMTLWYVGANVPVSLGERAPGPFRVTPVCSRATCEVLIATPPGAAAPSIDPMTCAPTNTSHAATRLDRGAVPPSEPLRPTEP
jgi:anti-sigma-K factor RskA